MRTNFVYLDSDFPPLASLGCLAEAYSEGDSKGLSRFP